MRVQDALPSSPALPSECVRDTLAQQTLGLGRAAGQRQRRRFHLHPVLPRFGAALGWASPVGTVPSVTGTSSSVRCLSSFSTFPFTLHSQKGFNVTESDSKAWLLVFLFPGPWLSHPRAEASLCLHQEQRRLESLFILSEHQIHPTSAAGGSRPPLLDFQDGGIGLHDGHDDPVNVILQAEVDLLLLLDCFHELISGDRADLCCQGLREGG